MIKIKLPNVQDNSMWDIWMSMYHLSILTVADEVGLFAQLRCKKLTLIELAEILHLSYRAVEVLVHPPSLLWFSSSK